MCEDVTGVLAARGAGTGAALAVETASAWLGAEEDGARGSSGALVDCARLRARFGEGLLGDVGPAVTVEARRGWRGGDRL